MRFNKLWVGNFGWEDTILCDSDFTKVVEIDFNTYIAIDANKKTYFLKR